MLIQINAKNKNKKCVTQIKKNPKIFKFTNSKSMGLIGLWQRNNYLRMPLKIFQYDSFYSFIATKNVHWPIQRDFIVKIFRAWWGWGRVEPFSEGLYSRNLGQIGVFGGNRLLGGVIFFRWGLKIPCIYKK